MRSLTFLAVLVFAATSQAQTGESRSLELEGGKRLSYTLHSHPADAHTAPPVGELAPTSPLNAAKLLNLHLSAGDIEAAALLSNAPRRRFDVLRDYRAAVGEEEFKQVFARYFYPENRLLAEIAIGKHRLLIWDLNEGVNRIAGQYFVEIEGKYLLDDVPNEARTNLRWVLEAYRAGKIAR